MPRRRLTIVRSKLGKTTSAARPRAELRHDSDLGPAAGQLTAQKLDVERHLCACVFAHLHKLLPIADALGIETGTFDGSDARAIWCAGLWAINSGRTRGVDRFTDQEAVAPFVRRGLEVVNCWRDDEQGATTSLWSPKKTVDLLFEGMPPSAEATADAARQLLRRQRRMERAGELYAQARQILESDDGRPEPREEYA